MIERDMWEYVGEKDYRIAETYDDVFYCEVNDYETVQFFIAR